jgi:hypothetical protein
MGRRIVLAGLAALLAAPAFLIQPASAAIVFTCDSVTGSAVFSPGLVHDTRAQSLSSGPMAPAGPADLTLASTSDSGVKGNGTSTGASLSGDGTKVAFVSRSTNLDPADTDSVNDVFVKDVVTGDIVLASTSDAGVKGNQDNWEATLSSDGSAVAFWSFATNLDAADSDLQRDVYVKDLVTGDLFLASASDAGVKGNGDSDAPELLSDGTAVAFQSDADNLDPDDVDDTVDVYIKDLTTGDVVLASTSDSGVKGNGYSGFPSLSGDGTRVAFVSTATNLDPADPDFLGDVYVKDLITGGIVVASTSDAGVKSDDDSAGPSLAAAGTKVAFASKARNFDPADTDTLHDAYVKDLVTGDITLASVPEAGVDAGVALGGVWLAPGGAKVAFDAIGSLDPADTDNPFDVYVRNLDTGDLTVASTSDTGVKGTKQDLGGPLTADGAAVAFESVSKNLDPGDVDNVSDIYVKHLPSVPTSIDISGCSNGNSGTASVVDIRSYGPRPPGCPVALGGTAGNDYADTTPILVGATVSMSIDWATGPNSYGVAAAKAGPTGTQWRFRLAITASPDHDTPATNQYLPAAGSGFTKTRLQGKLDVGALDSFNCTSGVSDPISWVDLVNNESWVAKSS